MMLRNLNKFSDYIVFHWILLSQTNKTLCNVLTYIVNEMNDNGLGLSTMDIFVSLRLSLVHILIIVSCCGLLMSMYVIDGPTFIFLATAHDLNHIPLYGILENGTRDK